MAQSKPQAGKQLDTRMTKFEKWHKKAKEKGSFSHDLADFYMHIDNGGFTFTIGKWEYPKGERYGHPYLKIHYNHCSNHGELLMHTSTDDLLELSEFLRKTALKHKEVLKQPSSYAARGPKSQVKDRKARRAVMLKSGWKAQKDGSLTFGDVAVMRDSETHKARKRR